MISLRVSLPEQTLSLYDQHGVLCRRYAVSTASMGPGEETGSYCTPRGSHVVRAKIGQGLPDGSVLVARRPTGEVYSESLRDTAPKRDWILTRILWLSGCESGRNRSGSVDTMRRYIYIHGTPDSEPMGVPGSHGCIRMRNRDIRELFELVAVGTPVDIAG